MKILIVILLMLTPMCVAAVVCCFWWIYTTPQWNEIIVRDGQYLDILDYRIWKSIKRIHEEMERTHCGRISRDQVCAALSRLEEEGLVDARPSLGLYETPCLMLPEFKRKMDFSPEDMGIPRLFNVYPPRVPVEF
jgi:hypothetical protein